MTTFNVTNNADSGIGSLRKAIFNANSRVGTDVIKFDSGLKGQTIVLTSETLEINDALTINGLGVDDLTLDRNGSDRVFLIDDGSANNIDVVIDNLTITGRKVTDNGGGILNSENLTLNNSRITDNSAEKGGGIYNSDASSITINNSEISDNFATVSGGGIYNSSDSSIVIDNSSISNNSISNNLVEANGGGIFNSSHSSIVINNRSLSIIVRLPIILLVITREAVAVVVFSMQVLHR